MANALAWADLKARLTAAGISASGTPLPIAWPNETFDSPPLAATPWLMVELQGGSSQPYDLGGTVWTDEGRSFVHVMVPTGSGVTVAMSVVDQAKVALRALNGSGVVYTRVTADPGGPGTDDGLYWRTTVTGEWQVQTIINGS